MDANEHKTAGPVFGETPGSHTGITFGTYIFSKNRIKERR